MLSGDPQWELEGEKKMEISKEKTTSAFLFAAGEMLGQARKSVLPGSGTCAYRGKDGSRCGVGHLIPDAEYSVTMEGRGIGSAYLEIPAFDGLDRDVLAGIQLVHDTVAPKDWAVGLMLLGRYFYMTGKVGIMYGELGKDPDVARVTKENSDATVAAMELME